jgi:2-iminobutanoate/2-iminopropanoate deaminase
MRSERLDRTEAGDADPGVGAWVVHTGTRQAKEQISTSEAPPPGGAYSQGIRTGGFVFLSGQTPRDLDREVIEGTFQDQVRKAIENLAAVARAAGGSLADAVSVRAYLREWDRFAEMDAVYRDMFPEPRPARTTVQSNLPVEFEIEAMLWVGGNGPSTPGSETEGGS